MHNSELIEDVKRLKAADKIIRDIEIASKTGYSKGLVSSYLSGSIKASKNFLNKFKEVYKNELAGISPSPEHQPEPSDDYTYPIILTEGKTAVLKFPRAKMSATDVEILRKVIEQIELSVGVNQDVTKKVAEDLKKKERQN